MIHSLLQAVAVGTEAEGQTSMENNGKCVSHTKVKRSGCRARSMLFLGTSLLAVLLCVCSDLQSQVINIHVVYPFTHKVCSQTWGEAGGWLKRGEGTRDMSTLHVWNTVPTPPLLCLTSNAGGELHEIYDSAFHRFCSSSSWLVRYFCY